MSAQLLGTHGSVLCRVCGDVLEGPVHVLMLRQLTGESL